MVTFITQVSATQINYAQIAKYTLNVSFNGIEGTIEDARIKVVIPNILLYTIGEIKSPIKSVMEESVTGGTLLIFNFGSITSLGEAIKIEVEVQFKGTTLNQATFDWEAQLWINGAVYSTSVVDTLMLVVVPNFQIDIHYVLPLAQPAAGGQVIMKVELENYGDQWAEISDIVITCQMPEGATLDSSFIIEGKDESIASYQDRRADGIQGLIAGNNFTFTIPVYRGQKYSFMYRYTIDSSLEIGHQLMNVAEWSIEEVQQDLGTQITTLASLNYHAMISKYGPDYTLPDDYISYELYVVNDGNQALSNVAIIDEIPPEVEAYEFFTGTFWIEAIERTIGGIYSVNYTTHNGRSGSLGPFNTDVNSRVDLTTIIPADDQVDTLEWNLAIVGIGIKQREAPTINGRVRQDVMLGSSILNHFHCSWEVGSERANIVNNQLATVQDLCVLYPEFKQISPNKPVRPGDYITYELTIDCRRSRLKNPRIAVLLPNTLEYVDTLSLQYHEYFPNPLPFPSPGLVSIPNFKNTGKTLIKVTYEGENSFTCRQRSSIVARFRARVPIGSKGTVEMNVLLNAVSNNGVVYSNIEVYRDHLDIAQTGQTNVIYAMSPTIVNNILLTASIESDKKVKGALDNVYSEVPDVGRTLEGGSVEYILNVTNIGNADLYSVEMVDILPHVGDTGVILTRELRQSQFPIYNINAIQGTISPLAPGQATPTINKMYSRSCNPIRFGPSFNIIGVDNDWSSIMPPINSELKSFKISTQNTILYPGQTLEIKVQCIAAIGALINQVAWNSFAAQVSYRDEMGNVQYLLAIEPEKVGVRIESGQGDRGSIEGVVFEDMSKNGIYEVGEGGMNDIPVVLYNYQLSPIQAVFTTPDVEGNGGHYLFSNLPLGIYYIRVIIDELEYKFSPQRLDVEFGSKVDSKIGVTPAIDLNSVPDQTNIHVGVIKRTTSDRIDEVLAMNTSANKMLRNATYNQLLLSMKLEDVKKLIEESK